MILESHHHVGTCGTCTIPNHEQNCNCTGSPCKEVSCPGQVLENLSWGLWQLRTCSGLWWYLLVWLEYSSGRGKQFPSRENGIHPSSWSSSAVSTPNLSTLPHRQMQPVASGPMWVSWTKIAVTASRLSAVILVVINHNFLLSISSHSDELLLHQ